MTRAAAIIGFCLGLTLSAQAPPAFEVASIKLHDPSQVLHHVGPALAGNRLTVDAMTVSGLVQYAYDLKSYQMAAMDGWANSDRYDIQATAPGDAPLTPDTMRPMLQSLLASRFQLRTHLNDKQIAIYNLVPASGGSKMAVSPPAEKFSFQLHPQADGGIVVNAVHVDLARLAGMLTANGTAGTPIMDHTGLAAAYDFTLQYVPLPRGPAESGATLPDSGFPGIFTAVQQQLGLKLEAAKATVSVLTLDRVERPTAN